MHKNSDITIRLKRQFLEVATGALIKLNIPFETQDIDERTAYLPSKMNGYDARLNFAKSIGCKNISQAISACGDKYKFIKRFKEWQS